MGIWLLYNGVRVAQLEQPQSVAALQRCVNQEMNLSPEEFYFTRNGRKIDENCEELINTDLQIILRVFGGKGGFGSMLRAIGAQIEKTTNREACRDLSGRRLRDINEEKRLKAWLEKEQDKKSDTYAKKKLERLLSQPKHDFKDEEYDQARSDLTANVDEAVEEGFKKLQQQQPGSSKRKLPETTKSNLWIADGLSGSDSDSDTDSDEPAQKKKAT